MTDNPLLTAIWAGHVRPAEARVPAAAPQDGAATLFLERSGTSRMPRTFVACDELEPGLTLADILAEEFDLYVSDATLVVLVEADSRPGVPLPPFTELRDGWRQAVSQAMHMVQPAAAGA